MVQTFIQIAEFLKTSQKKARQSFSRHRVLQLFDREFDREVQTELLKKIGMNEEQRQFLLTSKKALVQEFRTAFLYFERALSSAGPYAVGDGVTHNPVYNVRTLLRELPAHYLNASRSLTPKEFMKLARSGLANRRDQKLSRSKIRKIRSFLYLYKSLLHAAFSRREISVERQWLEIRMRASAINIPHRITGESVLSATHAFMKARKKMDYQSFHAALESVVENQWHRKDDLLSELFLSDTKLSTNLSTKTHSTTKRLVKRILKIVKENAEGI